MKIDYIPHDRQVIDDRVRWLCNPEIGLWFDNYEQGTTKEEQEKWFDAYEKDEERDLKTIVVDGQPVGFVGLSHINKKHRQAEMVIAIGDAAYRGRGIGRQAVDYIVDYAFRELKLHRVYLYVSTKNQPGIKCYRNAGFAQEGLMRDERIAHGHFEDTILMAKLNDHDNTASH